MQNLSKRDFIEYWLYLIWSFITVTSFPFLIGLYLFGAKSWVPLGLTLFMWFVLVSVLILKRRDKQQNPLYQILLGHVKIGGVTQAITALPGYLAFTALQSNEWIFAITGLIAYCGVTSIIASIFMAVYDLSLVRKMVALHTRQDSHSDDKTFIGYVISVGLLAIVTATVMTEGFQYMDNVMDAEGVFWVLSVSLIAALYLNVLIQAGRALYQVTTRN